LTVRKQTKKKPKIGGETEKSSSPSIINNVRRGEKEGAVAKAKSLEKPLGKG